MEQNQNQNQRKSKRFKLTLTEINQVDFSPVEYRTFQVEAVALEGQHGLDSILLKDMAGKLIAGYFLRKDTENFRPYPKEVD